MERAFAEQGFTYPALTARNYYISLQTKPFVLLSGLPGTGKTRLTSLFAEALTGDPTQYRLLPVRPDWTDSTPLLGGFGREGQAVTPFLEFLRRAERPENAHRAYFLCLDEMNLARVEHYFAEILSAMETPTRELLLPDGRALRLPANLFITGTLNAGEVTYPLSRKILDRANILAFHEVCLRDDTPVETGVTVSETRLSASRQATFLHARVMTTSAARAKLKQVGQEEMDLAARALGVMAEVNALLEPHGLHFAYRVRDEILRYCANSFDPEGRGLLTPAAPDNAEANLQTALDLQLTQRVLPRFTGAQEQLETPARDLRLWAERAGFSQTSRRLTRLLARLQREGFVGVEEG